VSAHETTDKPPAVRPAVVSPSQLLLAIAQHEPHEATLRALPGLTHDQLVKLLRGAAIALARASAPVAAGTSAAAASPEPQAASRKPQAEAVTGRVAVYSDGASRGNPGPAGAGAVVLDAQGRVIARLGKFLGRHTNNVAEYEGLLLGLRHALQLGAREVDVRADSELLIKQLAGAYRVKNEGLKPLFEEAQRLLKRFDKISLRHVPREANTLADEMSNRAIDEKM
jgi:ribonuclease HI